MIRTLDKQFQNLRRLDVLKIDVEGMEAEVLHGSAKLLTEFAPLIWMEHKPYRTKCGKQCAHDVGTWTSDVTLCDSLRLHHS